MDDTKRITLNLRRKDIEVLDRAAEHIKPSCRNRSAAARQLIQHGYTPFLEASLLSPLLRNPTDPNSDCLH